ncbi:hypothetical protein M1590_04170 [Candidatus Marsarchaeota archaeon]|nr:hypothetical protein [Candidatus Marsarchaeota archaeon]
MKLLHVLVAVMLFVPAIILAQSIGIAGYTSVQANATINSTANYINSINESGFLLFQPNLTNSYAYLNLAIKLRNSSPNTAVLYAQEARSAAEQQYQNMRYYSGWSILVMGVLALLFLFMLIRLGIPVKKKRKKR